MLNSLDLLIIVFMVLAAASLLSVCLMFLIRSPRLQRVFLYVAAALGLYICYASMRIFWGLFTGQAVVGLLLGALSVAAVVLVHMDCGDGRKFGLARILAALSVVLGFINLLF